ncbi:GNAT family N-acetyltransferase [Massilia sp. R2A-15]|uniref:GNAT family N-acetyltransferase n=1 Tax=Massilia sp. R2A-15 TaxID=3064278 RepID=UPI002732BDC0|nr:GNAT family N-acetyltransferase [Massilia sp. R2A-15]WLI88866.1 GNAT family N-acetyltransferase [Massilia sp. R2A-15]
MNTSTDYSCMSMATHAAGVLIRRADPGDRHRLTELMHSSSAYRGKYAAILAGYEISREQVENDLMYVAEYRHQLVGFFSLTNPRNNPELDLMFVSDDAQGKGVGRLLFDHLRTVARENCVTRIDIVAHPPAEEFYLRMGAFRSGTKEAGGRVSWERPVLSLEIK